MFKEKANIATKKSKKKNRNEQKYNILKASNTRKVAMADEFQGGVCGGNWWSSSRNVFGSSLCSSGINDIGSFGWPGDHLFDMKTTRSSDESASASDGSVVLQDLQKPHRPDLTDGTGTITMDSTLQMMNSGLSTSTTTSDWNQALFQNNSRPESNYSSMLQEDLNSGMNYGQESGMNCPQIQKEWSPKNYTSVSEDSSTNTFEPVNQSFALDHQHLSSITSSGDYTAACQGLSTSFSMNSSSSYGYPSNLLQTLFDTNPQPQKSTFDNQSMNFPSSTNYLTSLNDFSPSLPKLSPMLKASLPKQQQPITQLPFSNNTSLWNASAAALNDIRASFLPSTQLQMPSSTASDQKINLPNLTAKPSNEEVARKTNDEPAFKRPRIETPSPLPTFKVRKEKLGDRITALQQLVSPFGKTDTASVLHEAIDYIKFLHDQVSVLSTPYLKNGSPGQCQQTADKITNQEGAKQDLRSRGLCLVPISSTFPVAAETTTDFWTPTFGGAFR